VAAKQAAARVLSKLWSLHLWLEKVLTQTSHDTHLFPSWLRSFIITVSSSPLLSSLRWVRSSSAMWRKCDCARAHAVATVGYPSAVPLILSASCMYTNWKVTPPASVCSHLTQIQYTLTRTVAYSYMTLCLSAWPVVQIGPADGLKGLGSCPLASSLRQLDVRFNTESGDL